MIGYWNRPDATAETFVDGWLDTGDLVAADEQNYLWFRGRKKQIIIHDGSNICPQEVEDSLLEHPAVASAGVIGIHDLIHGENVRAYVRFRPGVERPTDGGADAIRAGTRRLQGPRRDRRARRDADQRRREGGPTASSRWPSDRCTGVRTAECRAAMAAIASGLIRLYGRAPRGTVTMSLPAGPSSSQSS